ncbi:MULTISPECIES: restriction endonuclease subunit S [unclassified Pseudoalteromonas]|jgi:type I restriction enzyme S subunit|uniref:restriction endonuclease subunit S n=1 Tax=unclassified Pseudoalteromonas TaxID=194690 RepID=UPI0018F45FEA|nr:MULTISPECIES: restriction endonuclease subunit S [unclassified Pseudoalteromonas]MDN3396125.1 restriction endonuclease subunit S [Pseudoalteromonas sp. APC 3215]MDN3471260.1 restriction endonuclease subunit S [Pseudoalteromonas sp. APC 4026]
MVPNGWNRIALEKIAEVRSGVAKGKKGLKAPIEVPYLRVANVQDGHVDLTEVKTIEIEQDKLERYSLKYGDVLMNEGGDYDKLGRGDVWLGQIEPCLHQNHVFAVRPNQDIIDSFFLAALAASNYGKTYFLSCAKRSTNLASINSTQIKEFPVLVPPLPEQKKIAQILSTWEKAITTTEQLLAKSQQQKKALMQQLLTGKKRLLDKNGVRFSGEWKRVELGDLLDYQQPTPYLVESTDYSDDFSTPVLTAGKTFILGYTDEESGIFSEKLPAIIFDDFTTDSKFVDFPFKAKSSAMKILTAKEGVSIKYVYEAMQLLDFSVGGHQRHWISIYSRLVTPFPGSEEQQKIAAVLSTADKEISALQQKLEAIKQEKKALMQQLLTGKRRVLVS